MNQHLPFLFGNYGLALVFVNVLLNQIGLPVPAIPTLILAGGLAANGELPTLPLFLVSVAACVAADCGWYLVGQQIRFERWGVNSLVIAKFIPGLATIAPPLAGAMRIGWPRFIFLSTLAAVLWVGAAMTAGSLFRAQIGGLLSDLHRIGSIASAVVLLFLCAYIGYKFWERRRFFKMLRMARISVAELYELIQAGAAPVIIDVRSATARSLEPAWIPGALHISLQDAAQHVKDLPQGRDIVLYCNCPSEASAARVARILMNHGLKRVRPLQGGLDAWRAAGHAVATPATASATTSVATSATTSVTTSPATSPATSATTSAATSAPTSPPPAVPPRSAAPL